MFGSCLVAVNNQQIAGVNVISAVRSCKPGISRGKSTVMFGARNWRSFSIQNPQKFSATVDSISWYQLSWFSGSSHNKKMFIHFKAMVASPGWIPASPVTERSFADLHLLARVGHIRHGLPSVQQVVALAERWRWRCRSDAQPDDPGQLGKMWGKPKW